jgi:hypothetical protein
VTSCFACELLQKLAITLDECGCGPQYVCVKCEANGIRQKSTEKVFLVHRPSILHDGLVSAGSLFCPMSFIWSKLLLYLRSMCNVVKMVNQIQAFRFVSITSRKFHINSSLEQMGFSNNVFSRLEIVLAELNHLVKIAVHEFVQYCRDGESDCVIRKRSDSIKFLSIKSEAFT